MVKQLELVALSTRTKYFCVTSKGKLASKKLAFPAKASAASR